MPPESDALANQLRRQSTWLADSWHWILNRTVLEDWKGRSGLPTALDVGCGPGLVMDLLNTQIAVQGLDRDADMVKACTSKGLDASEGFAEQLPFEADSFDLVYCSFLLLWVNDPEKVICEMKRVSRRWIICLAEPDFGGRLNYPDDLTVLNSMIEHGVREQGGDPHIGRKLRSLFSGSGMIPEIGVHPGVWDIDKLVAESDDEWSWLEMTVSPADRTHPLQEVKGAWRKALIDGSLFQYNPIFYAVARK